MIQYKSGDRRKSDGWVGWFILISTSSDPRRGDGVLRIEHLRVSSSIIWDDLINHQVSTLRLKKIF
jgi:hypothetical protein